MANFPSDRMTTRPGRDAWMHDNERGLALAADGDWGEASEAFAAAADSLARSLPSDPRGTHEPLALVLSNLAQAYFRCGRIEEAMQQAQRTCALRVAIAGEDGMPVARARMDLAVMLASAGRLDEATSLVQRAISAIEHRVGEEDARLAVVLENAARIALAAGNPANAEPLLLRLHALLDAHELSTARAEQLLARVAQVRQAQAEAQAVRAQEASAQAAATAAVQAPALAMHDELIAAPAVETPVSVSSFEDDAAARVYAHATIAELEEWEDQPLRDAVAVTDVLLRTTPSGVPVIPAVPVVEPPALDLTDEGADAADALLDTMDLTDVLPAPALREPDADLMLALNDEVVLADAAPSPLARSLTPLEPVEAIGGNVEFDLDLAFDEPAEPQLDLVDPEVPAPLDVPDVLPSAAPVAPPTLGGLSLGFTVEHGMIDEDAPLLQGPPISSPVPEALELMPTEPPSATVAPVTAIVSSGPTTGIAPIADIVQTSAVMTPAPAAASGPAASPQPTRASSTSDERVVMPAPTAGGGKGKLIGIIAGVLAVGGGAAAFFLLR